jgi:Zn-dependent peptidase ImmA (M78 family)
MSKFVPYLAEKAIERDAEALLAEYAYARDLVIAPPIPIEDIIENHLKLGVEFDDTHGLFGIPRRGLNIGEGPDILGAILFDQKQIIIDESLDPDENPSMEGRYRFTLAHEGGGHWRLHRHMYTGDSAQVSLFSETSTPSVVCRSGQSKERIEWQADFYASCVLMPREMVIKAWHDRFGNKKPRIFRRNEGINVGEITDPEMRRSFERSERGHFDQEMHEFARPFAKQFQVSLIAMRIRLEKLGLLLRGDSHQRILVDG